MGPAGEGKRPTTDYEWFMRSRGATLSGRRGDPRWARKSTPSSRSRLVPVDLDVVRGPAAGDDLGLAVAVEVRGQGVLAGHAAVVERVAGEGELVALQRRVEDEDAGPLRALRGVLVRVALADDDLVVAVAVEVGAPDGVSPGDGLGQDVTLPPRPARSDDLGRCVHDHLVAMPGLDGRDITGPAPTNPAELHLAGPLGGTRFLIPGADPMRLEPVRSLREDEDPLPSRDEQFHPAIVAHVDDLEVMRRMQP